MKQIIVKNRDQAQAFCEKAKSQAAAYWVQRKNPLNICKMERLSKDAPVTWMDHTEGHWWSSTLTIRAKVKKEALI